MSTYTGEVHEVELAIDENTKRVRFRLEEHNAQLEESFMIDLAGKPVSVLAQMHLLLEALEQGWRVEVRAHTSGQYEEVYWLKASR